MKSYVVGFLHDDHCVVLIEKCRPEWQKGTLNGVGGKVEEGEAPEEAMRRKFKEEAGLDITDWKLGVIMSHPDWRVRFYSTHGSVWDVQTVTDEYLQIESMQRLPGSVVPDLRWLIPLCLDSKIKKPVWITHD